MGFSKTKNKETKKTGNANPERVLLPW